MRLLVITQKVDCQDSNLGFFHIWLEKMAVQAEQLTVVCLQKGEYQLPANVKVYSLGKESGVSRLTYLWRFYKYIFSLCDQYDGVFVHMNPEYAILGGLFWRVWGKKVLLWYTHKAVNLRLRLAELFATKIFTASKESFRLVSKKVEVTGHGIPIEKFATDFSIKTHASVALMLIAGRVTRVKNLETIIRAIAKLKRAKEQPYWILMVGSPITKQDFDYKDEMISLAKELNVALKFEVGGAPYIKMPELFKTTQLFVHASQTGSMDKVVLEALAAGRIVVTSSEAYAHLAENELKGVVFRFTPGDHQELANTIEKIYQTGILQSIPNERAIQYVRTHHNLDSLVKKITDYFKPRV